ncbi:hypothetical protein L6R29_02515 [Myxococcota bacterium]|nr:hypothetical protein [Myxococcota bacterium]
MEKRWRSGWLCLCLCAIGWGSQAVASPKKAGKAFVVTRSVEGRNSAHTVKRARQRVLVAARERCGKQGASVAGVWRQQCRTQKGRVICVVKRRFVCGPRQSKRKMLAQRKRNARKRRVVRKVVVQRKGSVRKRLVARISRRERKLLQRPIRRMSLRGGACTRPKALRGVGRDRNKETAQKQARQTARRHASRQCKGRQVVWMAAWRYRCSKRNQGRFACVAHNNVRCCGGRMTARIAAPRKRSPLSSFAP